VRRALGRTKRERKKISFGECEMNFIQHMVDTLGLFGGIRNESDRTTIYFLILLLEAVLVSALRREVDVAYIIVHCFIGTFVCYVVEFIAALFFPDKLIRQMPTILALLILIALIFNK
jgi:hypothetical protein